MANEIGYTMSLFFDKKQVIDQIGKANAKGMSKAGSFIRQRARSSLRKRKKPSAAGSPPSRHGSDASLRQIQFYYDTASQSLIVGPILIRTSTDYYGPQLGSTTVPELHEFCKSVTIRERLTAMDQWVAWGSTPDPRPGRTRVRRATYPARPYMGPALKAEITAGKIDSGYAGVISR